ncbi:hypothetical protein SCB71_07255 [Herbiconiux sp. KACC 21604]|nr:hypothetical protein [Herbiconiux sp. SALV-R1]WPO88022.1 hypothetical protein SCB71_07255 [Herbiconiux sp. KACC 21604]
MSLPWFSDDLSASGTIGDPTVPGNLLLCGYDGIGWARKISRRLP